jgi:hypothetical protein
LQAGTVDLSKVSDFVLTEKTEGELEIATVGLTEQFQTIVVPYY